MDIGTGLASFGQNMASAMADYHKKHVAYDEQLQLAQALSRIGINPQGQITTIDPENKDKSITPIIDKKAYDQFITATQQGRERNAGAIEAMNRMAMHGLSQVIGPLGQANLQQEQARSTMYKRAADSPIVEDASGNRFMQTPGGLHPVTGGATTAAEAGRAQRHNVNTAIKLRKQIGDEIKNSAFGVAPEDFLRDDVVPGTMDDKGVFAPLAQGQQGGNAVGIPDGAGGFTPFSMQDWTKFRGKAAQYQKLGAVAFSGLSGGAQTAPIKVKTPDEARKLPPGTLIETPDGRVLRVKGQPAADTESAAEDSGESGEE
jgi:hypothetical protein